MGQNTKSILEYIHKKAYKSCVPLNAFIELTLSCNLHCIHCYNANRRLGGDIKSNRKGQSKFENELTKEEIINVIKEIYNAGCVSLTFTGGEPFLHQHLFEFLELTKKLNLSVNIITNGTLIDAMVARNLQKYPNIFNISVTLYGSYDSVHDEITGQSGSFKRTINGINYLKKNGIPTKLKFLVMRENVYDTKNVMDLARRLGIKLLIDTYITGRHNGDLTSLKHRVKVSQLEGLYKGELKDTFVRRRVIRNSCDFKCNCARTTCAISNIGDVYPCIAFPLTGGNIRHHPFKEIWTKSVVFEHIRRLQLTDFKYCRLCKFKEYCRRTNGAVFTYKGDYTSYDPWLCREARLIYRVYHNSEAKN